MNDMVEFAYSNNYNKTQGLDFEKTQYCTTVQDNPKGGFDYFLVDCDDVSQMASTLCVKYPVNCSEVANGNYTGGLTKRAIKESNLDDVFVKTKRIKRENEAQKARAAFAANFRKMDLKKSYPSLFEILWYTQLPCFDVENVTSNANGDYGMLKACFWKGLQMPCSKIFTTFPTDQGMCCTFNMDTAENMFLAGAYRDMVTSMQNRDRNQSFDRNLKMPDLWAEQNEPTSEAGRSKGLEVVLDAHSDVLSGGTVTEDFDGFYAIIDHKDQYPMTTRKSVLIRPGHNNFVSLGATQILASESIKDIEREKRNCLFAEEMKMKKHNTYTQANCLLECQLDFAMETLSINDSCLPWYFPTNDQESIRICNPWEARDFRKNMHTVPSDKCDHCLPDCRTTQYTASVTAAPFRRCDYKNLGISFFCNFAAENIEPPIWGQSVIDQYVNDIGAVPNYVKNVRSNRRQFAAQGASGKPVFIYANNENPTYDAYSKDIAKVTFFFESSTVFQFTRDERMTFVGYISQLGGLLGLFMGFSFVSAAEIIYWFTIRCSRNL